jgi:hypothetical protein
MPSKINLIGKQFGRLLVVKKAGIAKTNQVLWLCLCNCGKTTTVYGGNLSTGHTKSCGCLDIEKKIQRATKHGYEGSRIYITWNSMIQRCTNPKRKNYPNYGGRGIRVCERWLKFENFLADMGEQPLNRQIDRINNNEGYYLENCRWATRIQQARNKQNSCMETYKGKTQCMSAWAEEYNISYHVLRDRIGKLGWSIGKALITPIRKLKRKRK